jgi:hypothetical protein
MCTKKSIIFLLSLFVINSALFADILEFRVSDACNLSCGAITSSHNTSTTHNYFWIKIADSPVIKAICCDMVADKATYAFILMAIANCKSIVITYDTTQPSAWDTNTYKIVEAKLNM